MSKKNENIWNEIGDILNEHNEELKFSKEFYNNNNLDTIRTILLSKLYNLDTELNNEIINLKKKNKNVIAIKQLMLVLNNSNLSDEKIEKTIKSIKKLGISIDKEILNKNNEMDEILENVNQIYNKKNELDEKEKKIKNELNRFFNDDKFDKFEDFKNYYDNDTEEDTEDTEDKSFNDWRDDIC